MRTGTGEYRGSHDCGYARVHILCDSEDEPLTVTITLDEHEWNEQLRDGAFLDWTEAAIIGCRFALQTAQVTKGDWKVHRIVGLVVDTTPQFVAIASARAIWNAMNYSATVDALASLGELFV